jgi:hypothetical protein
MSVELRYRCCVEMIEKRDKIVRSRHYPRLKLISPDYDTDCRDCATRTAVRTPSAGRKPHQNKRKRAERSRTPSKASSAKRRCMFNSDG